MASDSNKRRKLAHSAEVESLSSEHEDSMSASSDENGDISGAASPYSTSLERSPSPEPDSIGYTVDLNRVREKPQPKSLDHALYTVGWVSALPLEMAAARAMLDEVHADLINQPKSDTNSYVLGCIHGHNVVIACLPSGEYGTTSAATIASYMLSSFPSIKIRLMVGIGGGVPNPKIGIRLGDVVVSSPTAKCAAVVQYDHGKLVKGGAFERTGTLDKPHPSILSAVSKLRGIHEMEDSQIPAIISQMLSKHPAMATRFSHPGQEQDVAFEAEYDHNGPEDTCYACDRQRLLIRPVRENNDPIIHYGSIASANQVMKHGATRDRIAKELGIICFEMEAAGLMDNFSCLVVRGICDYADSHKNKQWQRYAAATAAAYARELLAVILAKSAIQQEISTTTTQNHTDKDRQTLMDRLNFDQAGARQATIKTAHAKTCKWLLKQQEYLDWLDESKTSNHLGFLWIKGKPGTGKSTIMKYILAHCKRRLPRDTVCVSFFFNARGEDLERSTVGMYRSLLYQVLQHIPQAQDAVLNAMAKAKVRFLNDIGALQDLFQLTVQNLHSRCLVCFIDALDECPEDQVRDMTVFLKGLGDFAFRHGMRLHVCFSSRHYPHITFRAGLELILENQAGHNHDLERYLSSELHAGNLEKAALIKEILMKARGIFLWVVLVVKILNEEHDRGRVHSLQKRLSEIPNELNALFKDILTRDSRNLPDLLLCVQWMLFAIKPLTPKELHSAVLAGSEDTTLILPHKDYITLKDIERFILDVSKGLAQATKSKESTVQFIHESVRDFFLREGGLIQLWPELGYQIQGISHDQLKICCWRYINATKATRREKRDSELAESFRKYLYHDYPFLDYTTRYLLHHADCAEAKGVSQEDFINQFDLKLWIDTDNALQRYPIRHHTYGASLTYIAAEKNLDSLIKVLRKRHYPEKHYVERYASPIVAAFANGNENAVKVLLMPHGEDQIEDAGLQNLSSSINESTVDFLQSHSTEAALKTSLLSFLIERNKSKLVKVLLESPLINSNIRDTYKRTPLITAAKSGHTGIVRNLLNRSETDPNVQDLDTGKTALLHAISRKHEGIVQTLLDDPRTDPNQGTRELGTPLHLAIDMDLRNIVRLLLSCPNVDLNIREQPDDGTPLHYALSCGRLAIVKLLLAEKRIDVNLTNSKGLTPLQQASDAKWEDFVLQISSDDRVDLRVGDPGEASLLLILAKQGHHEGVERLLSATQVNPDLVLNNFGLTALYLAVEVGHALVVKTLLSHQSSNSSLDAHRGPNNWTPLHVASMHGRQDLVKILLAAYPGAVNDVDRHLETPLHFVAISGHTEVCAILLAEALCKPDQIDKVGRTPLSYAAERGYDGIVLSLLQTGQVNPHLEDSHGTAPYQYAWREGRYASWHIMQRFCDGHSLMHLLHVPRDD